MTDKISAIKDAYDMGLRYYTGEGVEQDYAQALDWFQKAAELGHDQAQFTLPNIMPNVIDRAIAQGLVRPTVYWYRETAEQWAILAQVRLRLFYAADEGVEQNCAQALDWFRKAAELGDAGAQCVLGIDYMEGTDVKQDYGRALYWFNKIVRNKKADIVLKNGVKQYINHIDIFCSEEEKKTTGKPNNSNWKKKRWKK